MANLYELQGAYARIQSMIESGEEGLEDTLESVEGALEEKLESYAMVIRNIESDVEGLKSEEQRLAGRRKSMESDIKRMKAHMQNAISSTGEKKIQGEKFTFTVQKNPPSLNIVDDKAIPDEFVTVETVRNIDKKALLAKAKQEEIPGVEIKQGEILRIR
ncbi:siphovirus Gp157 family protein [Rummeliibacillus stabekisii]|uniref:siphovirus Gp157 family protein n=1 Tax=Rummeliibacillus stabekisii TaxID=241244 RepID=UPI00371B3297